VHYPGGGQRRYRFGNNGQVAETSGLKLTGHVGKQGDDWFIDFNDGKIERVSLTEDRFFIEHWDPASSFGKTPPQLIAVGER
jgi:hypothetical protein